jgi:Flp pilus assembly protein TadB
VSASLLSVLAAALFGVGVMVGVLGFLPAPEAVTRPRRIRTRKRISRSTTIKLVVGLSAGFILGVVTGWVILIPLIPSALIGLPYLLGVGGSGDDIKRLDALDEWARSLSNVLGAGVSLEQAIITTQASAPPALSTAINALAARLRSRMSTEDALRGFAADVGDTTADKIACALILGARQRSVGLAAILEDLAESVAEDVASRRLVQAERAKQTTVVRIVTLITLVVFGGFLLMGGDYVAPYGTPIGQPILAMLISAYIGTLVWLRRMNRSEPLPRLLGGTPE